MQAIAPYLKALTAAIVAGLSVLATGLDDGAIDLQEGVFAAIAFFIALGAVWAVPNEAAPVATSEAAAATPTRSRRKPK